MSWKASATAKELTHGTQGERLSLADKLVLMILSENYIEKQGFVWCSQPELARLCLCTDRGLRGILARLERFGLVGIDHGHRAANRYRLLFMRNDVPQSEIANEERHDTPMRNGDALYEERHDNVSISLDSKTVRETVDGTARTDQMQELQERNRRAEERADERLSAKAQRKQDRKWKKIHAEQAARGVKPTQRPGGFNVQEVPTRSKGEARAERTRKALEILDHPEKYPEHLRRTVQARSVR